MRLPHSIRSISYADHEQGKKSETLIEGSFFIKVHGDTQLVGEFPRRVHLGDSIGYINKCNVLSPANGMVVLHKVDGIGTFLKIIQDGSLDPSLEPHKIPRDRETFFEILESTGVVSLDINSIPLSSYFRSFLEVKNSILILTPLTRYNQPNFKTIIQNDFGKDLDEFVSILREIFPEKEIHVHWESIEDFKRYPMGIPEYFLEKVGGYSILGNNPRDLERVFYLGGETIYHLLRGLIYNLPFTKRHLTVHCIDSFGRLDNSKRVYFLSHGQSIQFLNGIFSNNYKYKFLGHYTQESLVLKIDDEYYFDIFENSQIVFYTKNPKSRTELLCTECEECNTICPTHADPLGLISKLYNFRKENCIHCGLCTLYCPSGINLRKKISENSLTGVSS